MKKLFLSIIFLLGAVTIYAQAPDAFNYQAVARNGSGAVIPNQPIAVRLSIHNATAGGSVIYQERQTATTNQFGLFSVQIGTGTALSGTFSTIDWAGALKYLQVEFDPAGTTSYIDMGTTQLISVPYAKVANGINMFTGGTDNPDKMIIIHSPAYEDYGLQYMDSSDQFNFIGAGFPVLTIGLGSAFVGVGNARPAYPLDVSGYTTRAINAQSSIAANIDGAIKGSNSNGPYASLATQNNGIYAYSKVANGAAIYGDNGGSSSIGFAGYFNGQASVRGNFSVVNSGAGLVNSSVYANNSDSAGIGLYVLTNSTDATAVFTNATGSDYNPAIIAKFFDGGASDIVRIDNYDGINSGRVILWGGNDGATDGGFIRGSGMYGAVLGDIAYDGSYINLVSAYQPTVSTTAFSPWSNNTTTCGDAIYKWTAVYATNGTIQTSDERLKENVQPLNYGLNDVMNLKPVSYQWSDKAARLGNGSNLGFLAQDLEKVLPEVVVHDQITQEQIANAKKYKGIDITNTDTYGVKYSEIIPVLVKAIQEQQAEIDALKAQLNGTQK